MNPTSNRLPWLDWMRGIGALIMLQGHVFHSFMRNDLRESGPYLISQFVGGMPPALFLFLLGVTFSFLMDSQTRKGVSPAGRVKASVKRSGYLFAVAFAFRLQLWIVSMDKSPWTDLFRVDILNIMGFSLLLLAPMAAYRTSERIRLCAILGTAIALATPVISGIDWSGVPPFIRYYLIPDKLNFGIFPWASFVAFGLSAGSVLRSLKPDETGQAMSWFGWGGMVLAFSSWAISNMHLTVYSNADFWFNSPALIFIKLGVLLMMMAFAWVWNLGLEPGKWSLVRQFGTTSLLVYWVHVELVYGRALWFFKENLSTAPTVVMAVLVILLMLGLSLLRTNRAQVRVWWAARNPDRTFTTP
ncbi:MAG TPA: hypothetical protein VNH18_25115 [Bryobacteraceae bacterium]|nr:hypothetical protein [Bryobacteraceae bacterium]